MRRYNRHQRKPYLFHDLFSQNSPLPITFKCYPLPLTFFCCPAINSFLKIVNVALPPSTTCLSSRHSFFCLLLRHFPASIFQIFIFKFQSVWQNAKHIGGFQTVSQICRTFLSERRHHIFVRQIQHLQYITSVQRYFVGVHRMGQL